MTYRAAVEGAVDRELRPVLASIGHDGPLDDDADSRLQHGIEASEVLGSMPRTDSGETDWVAAGLLVEVLARTSASLAMRVVHDTLLPPALLTLMAPHTRERFAHLLSGKRRFAGAFSDSQAGSNLLETCVTAERHHREWTFSGTKEWVTGGHRSDTLLVTARIEEGPTRDLPLVLPFLLERSSSPYRTEVVEMVGLHANPLARVDLDEVRGPAEACIDDSKTALELVLGLILRSRCLVAAAAVGVAQHALDLAVQHAGDRRQFGKRIGSFQLVQEMIADMAIQVSLGRLAYLRAMSLLAEGREPRVEASMAKHFCSNAVLEVTETSAQVHGARGLAVGTPVELLVRDARMLAMAEGTTQIHSLIIARGLTGMTSLSHTDDRT